MKKKDKLGKYLIDILADEVKPDDPKGDDYVDPIALEEVKEYFEKRKMTGVHHTTLVMCPQCRHIFFSDVVEYKLDTLNKASQS